LDLERREKILGEKFQELEGRESSVQARQAELECAFKGMEEREIILKAKEDDVASRRREELQRQLGEHAATLLPYSESWLAPKVAIRLNCRTATIGLQKIFGRHNALGLDHLLRTFDFTRVCTMPSHSISPLTLRR
jgi:hypothetical protein